ncbi:uncharacterized protein LOC123309856 [Coccinella septempunctata]|uniref:uncharacterized protein LOC123309856 n=1 Tax=Coccinella septempunctata TaxID=41139 RepID=UPI001D074992|nr:uncharacterized protein LOC123309856 [Coccinella septempunctata]
MAQAFVTTYRNHFRNHKEPLRKSKRPLDRHAATAPAGDYWLDTAVKKKKDLNIPLAEALINESSGRLMFSTYQMNYCTDKVKEKCREKRELVQRAAGDKSTQIEEQSFENELLRYCRELYSTKTKKILPPTETARRVYGYIRPESMYTPLTHYQMVYGKAGFDIMSNPMQFLNIQKEKEENNNFPLCSPENVLQRTSFHRCEDLKNNRIRKEKVERQKKLQTIMENLDRCTNHVKNDDAFICPCQFIY